MAIDRPCRACIHYEWCKGRELCNSFVSKEDVNNDCIEIYRAEKERAEYFDAYIAYIKDRS